MKYNMYVIRDLKSEFYSPKVGSNHDSMKREFASLVKTEGTIMNQFPEDFELYCIGYFDSKTGVVHPIDGPEFICRGTELVGVKNA